MARWDEILTLPVQNPPTLEFSAADIVWSRVEGWRESIDRLALIPFSRVNDFVRGESNSKECPTRFHVEARRRRPPEMAYKPKVDGILEYILYWCSFGPDDHRKGGVVRPSRIYNAKRKTPAGRPNTKRGCVCHFIVKRLIAEPSVALVIYNQDKHVDKKGLPCHGPLDKKAVGTQAMFAPYISDELRLQITSLLYVGVPVETIMQRHTEAVEKQGGPCNRDDLLTHRYVRRLERKIRRSTYDLDPDDAISIGLWIENHPNYAFFYEDFSDSEPFILGIQSEWQLQQMIRFGNRRLLAADSRFGTNKLKYPIYSLLVFDSNDNAIPVAWILTPNFASGEIHKWMGALNDRVRTKDPTWTLGGFIVDDPLADVLAIREIFQCSVLVSFWRVRHAWHKSLMEKCPESEMRVEMSRRLGKVVSSICRGIGDVDSFEVFMNDFVDCSSFIDYFKATWFPRIGMWTAALKALPLASTEASAAIECYHHQLKLRLLNEKDSNVYQRADWLVDKLGTKVHSYYWLDEYSGKENFARYWKDEWKSGLTSWRQALQIPNSDVIVDGKCAKVASSENREEVHTVMNPGSEFALCDCSWSRMGNICMHVIKSMRIYRARGLTVPSASLFEYNRTLMTVLHCPPHDSVIRDHAVALAACVRTQLNALFDLGNGNATKTASAPTAQLTAAEPGFTATDNWNDADRNVMNDGPFVRENNAEARRNESHVASAKYGVEGETVNGTAADDTMLPSETPSAISLPVKGQIPADDNFVNDPMENEAGNLLKEKVSFDSNISNATREGYGDDMSVDACCDETAIHMANEDLIRVDCDQDSVDEGMMNTDLQPNECFASTSRSGITDGVAVDGCSSQMSNLIEEKTLDVSGIPGSDAMIIETVECIGDHKDTEKEAASDDCCHRTPENVNCERTDVIIESGTGSYLENSEREAKKVDTSGIDKNSCSCVGGTAPSAPNSETRSSGV